MFLSCLVLLQLLDIFLHYSNGWNPKDLQYIYPCIAHTDGSEIIHIYFWLSGCTYWRWSKWHPKEQWLISWQRRIRDPAFPSQYVKYVTLNSACKGYLRLWTGTWTPLFDIFKTAFHLISQSKVGIFFTFSKCFSR